MTPSDEHIRTAITRVAANWFAAHRGGSLSDADRAEFLAWLKASPLHIEEYLGIAALEHNLAASTADPDMSKNAWSELARTDQAESLVEYPGLSTAPKRSHESVARRSWLPAAIAASCLGAALLSALWLLHGANRMTFVKAYRTGHGEQASWPLPDGSSLHINTDTAVTVRFSSSERLLDVDHGQVSMEVAHEEHRAFRVHAGSTDAVALGTEFDVYRLPDSTIVTVMAGHVAVSQNWYASTGKASSTESLRAVRPALRVGPGQRVIVAGGVMPTAAQPADLRASEAWLQRKVLFERRALGDVADEFNRYNELQFVIDDPALRELPISGAFDAADTESFAAFLGSLAGVRVERLPNRIRIVSAGRRDRRSTRVN